MEKYVALLRAVNVGGTGKLAMADLAAICSACGFAAVQTHGASGNALFCSGLAAADVKAALEAALGAFAGKSVSVLLRTADEMAAVAAANPFPMAAPDKVMAIFLDDAPAAGWLEGARGLAGEEMEAGVREIYVHYPQGAGRTKLVIAAAKPGTARNMNTVSALAAKAAVL